MYLHLWLPLHRQFPQPHTESRQHKAETDDRYARSNPSQKRPFVGEVFSRPLRFIYRRLVSLLLHLHRRRGKRCQIIRTSF
jgi:hypothetical protein